MAGYDDNGPQLYQIDPSGSYFAWKASAIGKNMTNAKTFLEKRFSEVSPLAAVVQMSSGSCVLEVLGMREVVSTALGSWESGLLLGKLVPVNICRFVFCWRMSWIPVSACRSYTA